MATLYITEFQKQATDQLNRQAPAGQLSNITHQTVTISAVSAQSAVLQSDTTIVRLVADTTCWVEIGPNPTATNAKMRVVADTPEYFGIIPNQSVKLAAITA